MSRGKGPTAPDDHHRKAVTEAVANFDEIDRARQLLGLGDRATLKAIKHAYRLKSFQYHPDTGKTGPQGDNMMKELNWAYRLLIEYCNNYSYSFKEEDIVSTYPYDEYLRKHYYDWF
jgi:hypothetical protein